MGGTNGLGGIWGGGGRLNSQQAYALLQAQKAQARYGGFRDGNGGGVSANALAGFGGGGVLDGLRVGRGLCGDGGAYDGSGGGAHKDPYGVAMQGLLSYGAGGGAG
jgi:hypothetical protein